MFNQISAYKENPRVNFKDQEDGEVVLLMLRRHFFTNLPWLLTTLLLLILPIVFLLSPFREVFPVLINIPDRYLLFTVVTWYLIAFGFFLLSFIDWFFNIDLVTSKRILDVDFWGFLFIKVSETPLGRIQDVTYSIAGLAQTLLNYGDVFIQTAGTSENFEFSRIPNPAGVHDLITDIIGEENG